MDPIKFLGWLALSTIIGLAFIGAYWVGVWLAGGFS